MIFISYLKEPVLVIRAPPCVSEKYKSLVGKWPEDTKVVYRKGNEFQTHGGMDNFTHSRRCAYHNFMEELLIGVIKVL